VEENRAMEELQERRRLQLKLLLRRSRTAWRRRACGYIRSQQGRRCLQAARAAAAATRCWWVGGGCLVEGCRIAVRRLDGGQEPLAVFGMIALGLANAKLTGNLAD